MFLKFPRLSNQTNCLGYAQSKVEVEKVPSIVLPDSKMNHYTYDKRDSQVEQTKDDELFLTSKDKAECPSNHHKYPCKC